MKLTVEIVTLVLGIAAMLLLMPRFPLPTRARRRRAGPPRPEDLARIERVVSAGRQNAGDVHVRLRPLLRDIAALLLRRHGVRLDHDQERARALLGQELWEVVEPDRPRPAARRAPGLELPALERFTERLERL